MDCRRDRVARRRWMSLDVESRHRKMAHAPARGRQVTGERRCMTALVWLFSDGVAIGV